MFTFLEIKLTVIAIIYGISRWVAEVVTIVYTKYKINLFRSDVNISGQIRCT
jgi:hypothetical protein